MNYEDAEALGRPWGAQVAKGVVGTLEGAQPKGTTTRAKRYAHNGLEDRRLTKRKLVQDRGAPNAT